MKKFTYILLFLVFVYISDLSAFEPKVSYLKEPLPLFNISSKKLAEIEQNNPNDPTLLEMKKISRENIKQLPDELDFGNVSFEYSKKLDKIQRYHIYNYTFEGLELNAGLALYETLDSISLFPAITELGEYVSQVTFKWEEVDAATGNYKYFKKTIYLKANVVENSESISNANNVIKEIWYANPSERNYEDNGNDKENNFRIQGGGTLILPDISDYENLGK